VIAIFLEKFSEHQTSPSNVFPFREDKNLTKNSMLVILMKEVIYKLSMPVYRSHCPAKFKLSHSFISLLLIYLGKLSHSPLLLGYLLATKFIFKQIISTFFPF